SLNNFRLKLLADFVEHRFNISNLHQRHQLHAILFEMGDAFKVVRIMPAHLEDTRLFAFPFERFPEVGAAYSNPFGEGRARQVLAGLEEMLDLAEYPRITDGGTANHNTVHFVLHTPSSGLFHTVYIDRKS